MEMWESGAHMLRSNPHPTLLIMIIRDGRAGDKIFPHLKERWRVAQSDDSNESDEE